MKKVVINDKEYEIVKDYRDGFDEAEVKSKLTEYFDNYDYVAGDWAYGKLRLKGFYDEKNKKATNINNVKFFEDYIKNNCATNCKHFLMKKIN